MLEYFEEELEFFGLIGLLDLLCEEVVVVVCVCV